MPLNWPCLAVSGRLQFPNGGGIEVGRMGIERAKHALDRPFDEQIVVHRIDEVLADQPNGVLKNVKTPIELWDGHLAKVGVAYVQSRNDPGQGRKYDVGPEFAFRVAEPGDRPGKELLPRKVCSRKARRKCANEVTHLLPSSAHPTTEQGSSGNGGKLTSPSAKPRGVWPCRHWKNKIWLSPYCLGVAQLQRNRTGRSFQGVGFA
jgi:hypothetical protein